MQSFLKSAKNAINMPLVGVFIALVAIENIAKILVKVAF
jgi:hypothetical protein